MTPGVSILSTQLTSASCHIYVIAAWSMGALRLALEVLHYVKESVIDIGLLVKLDLNLV
jgi:hypothetical protein